MTTGQGTVKAVPPDVQRVLKYVSVTTIFVAFAVRKIIQHSDSYHTNKYFQLWR